MQGTDQYKQVSNKPFGDRTGRIALEWGSRGRARALPVAEKAKGPVRAKDPGVLDKLHIVTILYTIKEAERIPLFGEDACQTRQQFRIWTIPADKYNALIF
jgi:hypothetical protein